jgi:hypothetical protein
MTGPEFAALNRYVTFALQERFAFPTRPRLIAQTILKFSLAVQLNVAVITPLAKFTDYTGIDDSHARRAALWLQKHGVIRAQTERGEYEINPRTAEWTVKKFKVSQEWVQRVFDRSALCDFDLTAALLDVSRENVLAALRLADSAGAGKVVFPVAPDPAIRGTVGARDSRDTTGHDSVATPAMPWPVCVAGSVDSMAEPATAQAAPYDRARESINRKPVTTQSINRLGKPAIGLRKWGREEASYIVAEIVRITGEPKWRDGWWERWHEDPSATKRTLNALKDQLPRGFKKSAAAFANRVWTNEHEGREFRGALKTRASA